MLQLMSSGLLTEPTPTFSPCCEARRAAYDDRLLGVSNRGDWDAWLTFFADGLTASARSTQRRLQGLLMVQSDLKLMVQSDLKAAVWSAGLPAERAMRLVDITVGPDVAGH